MFWAGVLVFGITLGLIIQFTRAWVDPSGLTPPGGDIAAPINVGTATQTKHGGDICVDTNNDGVNDRCLSDPGSGVARGTIFMWSGSLASLASQAPGWILCNGTNGTPDLRDRFVYGVSNGENPGATGGSPSASVGLGGRNDIRYAGGGPWAVTSVSVSYMPPYYKLAFIVKMADGWVNTDLTGGDHNQSECTSAGGTVQTDGSSQFCKFIRSSCPSGWSRYHNWSTTAPKSKTGTNDAGCDQATNCTTKNHTWADNAQDESCTYQNGAHYSGQTWTGQTYYSCRRLDDSGSQYYRCNLDGCFNSEGIYYCYTGSGDGMYLDGYCYGGYATDDSNTYGCGYNTSYDYCSAEGASINSDITEIGCK